MAETDNEEQKQALGKRLRRLRDNQSQRDGRKLYQRDVARLLGIKEETYRSYEYGRSRLPEEAARRLAAEWGVEWREFYRTAVGMPLALDDVRDPGTPIPHSVEILYVGSIGANEKVNWLDPTESDDLYPVPYKMAVAKGPGTQRFACSVIGDSCYDLLWPEDVAVFQRQRTPKLNHVMIYRSDDGRVTIKQIKHDGQTFILHPLNPSYSDEPIVGGQVLGYLVGIVRRQGSREITVYDENGIIP